MTSRLEFGFPIPQVFLDGRPDMALVGRTLALGERLGYASAWVQDQVAGDVPMHESLTLMAYAAALTSRVKLGVSVLVFPIRNAVHVAKIASTLDNLSGGRIILGIGLGHVAAPGFFETYSVSREDALDRVYLASIPQHRMLDPSEIATMARFLASEEARGITGQAINVSAGFIMH